MRQLAFDYNSHLRFPINCFCQVHLDLMFCVGENLGLIVLCMMVSMQVCLGNIFCKVR